MLESKASFKKFGNLQSLCSNDPERCWWQDRPVLTIDNSNTFVVGRVRRSAGYETLSSLHPVGSFEQMLCNPM